jgi:hypothetical protein
MRSAMLILRDIDAFSPVDGNWLGLDVLLDELWASGVREGHIPTLLAVFERFPEDDTGPLWSILHGLEALPFSYAEQLKASLSRRHSRMGEIMQQRQARSGAT